MKKRTNNNTSADRESVNGDYPLKIVGVSVSSSSLELVSSILIPEIVTQNVILVISISDTGPGSANHRRSILSELASRASAVSVCEPQPGDALKQGQIHVVFSDDNLILEDVPQSHQPQYAFRRITEADSEGLLRSIGSVCESRAIGVLVGSETDSISMYAGLRCIKNCGGRTVYVDNSESGDHVRLEKVVEQECADFILNPEELAGQLVHLLQATDESEVMASSMSTSPGAPARVRLRDSLRNDFVNDQRHQELQDVLVDVYAPDSVMLTTELLPLRLYGEVSNYLGIPDGSAGFDFLALIRREFRSSAISVLSELEAGADVAYSDPVSVSSSEADSDVRLVGRSLTLKDDSEAILISFEPYEEPDSRRGEIGLKNTELEAQLVERDRQLRRISEELQSCGQQFGQGNADFRAQLESLEAIAKQFQLAGWNALEQDLNFATIAESLDEVVWVTTPGITEVRYVSPAFEAIWQKPIQEAMRDPLFFLEQVHEDDRSRVEKELLNSDLQEWRVEYRVVREDGSTVWLRDHRKLVPCNGDQERLAIGSSVDITSQIENVRQVAESEHRFRSVFQNASVGMGLVSIQSNILTVNDYICEWLGYGANDLTRMNLQDLVHSDDSAEFMRQFEQTTQGSLPDYRMDIRFNNSQSQAVWGRVSVSYLSPDGHGEGLAVVVMTDISEEKNAEKVAYDLANYDPLTELPNRNLLRDRIREQIKSSIRSKSPFYLLFVDLDHYKEINDSAGHDIGDEVLKEVASRLKNSVRDSDTVARFGGDEFILILSEVEHLGVLERICRKLLAEVGHPYRYKEGEFWLSASIGVASYPTDATEVEKLLQYADTAMYATKKAGGNSFSFFSENMNSDIKARVKIKNELRSALENDDLKLYFQPIYNTSTEIFDRAEVLVRWEHQEKGMVLPSEFIPMAEHSELIRDVDLWVFKNAVKFLKNGGRRLKSFNSLSLNVSSSVLNSPLYEDMLRDSVDVLDRIEFENSEATRLRKGRHSNKAIDFIRNHGGRISIDDFGSGFSSLAHLQSAPVNTIKIGQQFVSAIKSADERYEIIDAMVAIAKAIDAEIVASGVESEDQVRYLSKFENMFLQGFYFSKPLSEERFIEFLTSEKNSKVGLNQPTSIRSGKPSLRDVSRK